MRFEDGQILPGELLAPSRPAGLLFNAMKSPRS